MLGGSGGAHSSFARYVQHACLLVVLLVARPCGLRHLGAGVLVETLGELATRGKRTSTSGKSAGEGLGARVAVRSVLEDHETAILELERVVLSIEDGISELEHKVVLTGTVKAEFELFRHATFVSM